MASHVFLDVFLKYKVLSRPVNKIFWEIKQPNRDHILHRRGLVLGVLCAQCSLMEPCPSGEARKRTPPVCAGPENASQSGQTFNGLPDWTFPCLMIEDRTHQ